MRYKSIDFMKGIAMIMVILVHYEQSFGICRLFNYLQMGCPIFFVCSGFGIMNLIQSKYDGCVNNKRTIQFYCSRFKALAPGWYLTFLLIYAVNTVLLIGLGKTMSFGQNRGIVSILCNLLFVNGLLPFCNNDVMPGGWYIGATVILYFLTPTTLLLFDKIKNKRLFFVFSSLIDLSIWLILKTLLKEFWSLGEGFSYTIFFIHFPSYLLGIMLYNDIKSKTLSERQIKLCLPFAIISLIIAVFFFYGTFPINIGHYLSSWLTALFTYLILYFLITGEVKKDNGFNNDKRSFIHKIGENSYYIFLLHAFWTWSFVSLVKLFLSKFNISIVNPFGFIILMPIVIICSYYSGIILKKIITLIYDISDKLKIRFRNSDI